MVCFVLRPGPPPTGLKPPLINYTSTSTTVATTPFDFMDNDSMLPDNAMYDEMMNGGGDPAELETVHATTEMATTNDSGTANNTVVGNPLIYEDGANAGGGGIVNLHGKSSSSDRGKHRSTWNQANRTFKTNYTFNYNKVIIKTRCALRLNHDHIAWRATECHLYSGGYGYNIICIFWRYEYPPLPAAPPLYSGYISPGSCAVQRL